MPTIDEDGQIVTDEEDEYTDDDEYVTDEDAEFVEEEDGEIEELDEEDEVDDEEGEEIQGIPQQRGGPTGSNAAGDVKEWRSLGGLPANTRQLFQDVISDLRSKGKWEVTVLLLGKNGVGKSSTANSLLNEQAFAVTPFQQDIGRPVTVVRNTSGFQLRIIDTPGLVDGDTISERALQLIQAEAARTPVDVVLYLDRLDFYRVEPVDHSSMEAISRVLGPDVWQHTVLGLTRSQMTSPPPGTTYETFLARRLDTLQRALQGAGAGRPLPYVLIENSSKCNTNDSGEKVLPNGSVWLPRLMQKIAEQATASRRAFKADAKAAAHKANPNRRGKLWIPFILAAQIAFKIFVLDRLIEDDGVRGDEYGPFDKETVAEERARLKREKAERRQRQQEDADKERSARAAAALYSGSAAQPDEEGGEDDEEEAEEAEEAVSSEED